MSLQTEIVVALLHQHFALGRFFAFVFADFPFGNG